MDIYSSRLLVVVGLTSPVSFTTPAGRVAVLRCLDLYSGGYVDQFATYLEGSSGQTIYMKQWSDVNGSWAGWRGRQVLYAGESVLLRSDEAVDATLSGYLLTAP